MTARQTLTRTGVISLMALAYVAAQEPADVSGVWQMDASRSESAHQAQPIGPVTLVITRNADGLTIETRKGAGRKSSSSEKLTYKFDGPAISTADTSGGQKKAKAQGAGPTPATHPPRNVQGSTVTTMSVFSLDAS